MVSKLPGIISVTHILTWSVVGLRSPMTQKLLGVILEIATSRGSCLQVFCKNNVTKNFAKVTGKTCSSVSFLSESCNFFKKRPWHKFSPAKFTNILRTRLFIEHLRWLPLYFVPIILCAFLATSVKFTKIWISFLAIIIGSDHNFTIKCTDAAWKMKFSIKNLFSKCDQIRSFLRIWSHLQKKSLVKNIFCVVWAWESWSHINLKFDVTVSSGLWSQAFKSWTCSKCPINLIKFETVTFTSYVIYRVHFGRSKGF